MLSSILFLAQLLIHNYPMITFRYDCSARYLSALPQHVRQVTKMSIIFLHLGLLIGSSASILVGIQIACIRLIFTKSLKSNTFLKEARKINGAVFQSFVYNQFLQVVLGSKISLIGTYSGFIEAADPQISHEFASAAARLHGTIQEVYPLVDSNFRTVGQYRFVEAVASTRRLCKFLQLKFKLHFLNLLVSSGVGLIIRGLIITPARKIARLGKLC